MILRDIFGLIKLIRKHKARLLRRLRLRHSTFLTNSEEVWLVVWNILLLLIVRSQFLVSLIEEGL
jgi:hypothetical protein